MLQDFKDRILLINGVSKSFAMTGWRIGYAAGPKDIIYAMKKIQSQSTSCPSSVSQAAATEALKHDKSYLKDRTKIYQDNRNYVYHALSKIDGIKLHSPEGAFYAFLNVEDLIHKKTPKGKSIETDEDLAIYFLEEGRVALIPGAAMGLSPYLRISFSEEPETIKAAISRIEAAIKELI